MSPQFILPIFLAGTAFGAVMLPVLIERFGYIFLDNSKKVSFLKEKNERADRKKIRSSNDFKERLNLILKVIKQASAEGKTSIELAHKSRCYTDTEIKKELERRKFSVYESWSSDDIITVSWKTK